MLWHACLLALTSILLAAAVPAPGGAPSSAAARLALQEEDLPGTFGVKGGRDLSDHEHVALFLKPEVVAVPDLPEGGLYGVMAGVAVHPDVASAQQAFVAAGGLSAAAVRADLEAKAQGVDSVSGVPLKVPGADDSVTFLSRYVLQGVPTVEYRTRALAGTAVVNVVISARATGAGAEPPELLGQVQHVLARQLARVAAAGTASP